MPESKVALVEVFHSVQGEGHNAGRAAIFVRTAGCNLSCVFAEGAVCDTPYQKARLKLTVSEIMAGAEVFIGCREVEHNYEYAPMLILTGGEPTLCPQFDSLVWAGLARGFYVAVETNGTRWRDGLGACHWITVSPKRTVAQGSPMPYHNPHPQSAALDPRVESLLALRATQGRDEYRYVISGGEDPAPQWCLAYRHYVSPAVLADGAGREWESGFPGFVPGALERCLEIVQEDPRWRISLQIHKLMGMR